jgi:Putative prokaryotic signal transducing protein
MADEPQAVATAINQPEAEMICGLLSDAGIGAIAKPTTGVGIGFNAGGPLAIYVEAEHAEAARQLLAAVAED